jgi:flagellar M-ring protein FliF
LPIGLAGNAYDDGRRKTQLQTIYFSILFPHSTAESEKRKRISYNTDLSSPWEVYMPSDKSNYVNQIRGMWFRLQSSQRLTIMGFGLLGVVIIGVLVYFVNKVEYQPLYVDLSTEDFQAIESILKEQRKDFIVRGTSILVAAPSVEVDRLRLEIAGSGFARSGKIGYEIFDKNQFYATDITEQVKLQRAIEGELERTISSLSEISRARVHIVLGKNSCFQENKEDSRAIVILTLKKGSELSKSRIHDIKGVVAGAVPGSRTRNVSIVDEEGMEVCQKNLSVSAPVPDFQE